MTEADAPHAPGEREAEAQEVLEAGAPAPGRPGDPAAPGGRPTLAELATLLALAVGVREPLRPGARAAVGEQPPADTAGAPNDTSKLRRWTAAGGNIGSVTAYVLVPGGASSAADGASETQAGDASPAADGASPGALAPGDGGSPTPLAPGVYAYIERDHALALVGPPPGASGVPDGSIRLVLTGNMDKLAKKYMSFGLRLAIQDCGCSLEVIRLVARCLDLPLRARALWDERELAAAIGADPRREPVVAVIDLGIADQGASGGRHAH